MNTLYQHTEFRDLLAAVAQEPLDDAVRLVLADWLEEHGDLDRATFIRSQIERANRHPHDPVSVILSFDEGALLNKHRQTWLADLPDWLRPHVEFQRGLPALAELKAADFLEHASDDWSHIPVHELDLKEVGNLWGALFDCERMSRITLLNLHRAGIGNAGMKKLASSPHLSRLRHLRLYDNGITATGMAALARSPHLTQLAKLRLGKNQIGRAGIESLASTGFLSQLTSLQLYDFGPLEIGSVQALLDGPIDNLTDLELTGPHERLERKGVEALAGCARLRKLEDLDLQFSLNNDEDIEILASSPYLTNLRHFCFDLPDAQTVGAGLAGLRALGQSPISRNVITLAPYFAGEVEDEAARIVADSPSFANLRNLEMPYSGITPAGIEALVASPYLTGLTELDLDTNPLGDAGVSLLVAAPFAANLLTLSLWEVGLTAAGARKLATSNQLGRLRYLNVCGNPLGDVGLEAICRSSSLTELRMLAAHECRSGPAVAKGLAFLSSSLPGRLRHLDLARNSLGDEGAGHLANCPALVGLDTLDLRGNNITDEGARALLDSPYLKEAMVVNLDDNPGITIALRAQFTR